MLRRALSAFICIQVAFSASAYAQDRGALQAASLFQQSCIRFTGRTDLLREWIRTHGLSSVPSEQAKVFAGGHPSLVFGASTPDGKMALVSENNGACRVVVEQGAASGVEQALTSILARSGVTVSEVLDRPKPSPEATQRLYRATIGLRHWVLSVTSHDHTDAPGMQPEIILLATVDDGRPLSAH